MPITQRILDAVRDHDRRHVLVETPEHEVIHFEGCCSDETDAKLHDLEAWAS